MREAAASTNRRFCSAVVAGVEQREVVHGRIAGFPIIALFSHVPRVSHMDSSRGHPTLKDDHGRSKRRYVTRMLLTQEYTDVVIENTKLSIVVISLVYGLYAVLELVVGQLYATYLCAGDG